MSSSAQSSELKMKKVLIWRRRRNARGVERENHIDSEKREGKKKKERFREK